MTGLAVMVPVPGVARIGSVLPVGVDPGVAVVTAGGAVAVPRVGGRLRPWVVSHWRGSTGCPFTLTVK